MVAFKKDSAREIDKSCPNGCKMIFFKVMKLHLTDRTHTYRLFYKKPDKFYEMIYPQTLSFPNGEKFVVSKDYQVNVCKTMINAASKNEKFTPQ